MLYVASVRLGSEYSGSCDVSPTVGKGYTEEEAIRSCLQKIRSRIAIDVELKPGVQLPPKIAAKMPTILPEGYGLLILERGSHGDGHPYDWRFFAVKRGTHTLRRLSSTDKGWEYTVGDQPAMYSFLDCNGDYKFSLPDGSKEFVDGEWVYCLFAQYDY